MATDTVQVSPPTRLDPRQLVNTLKKTVNFGDAAVGTGNAFDNSLPIGAFIIGVKVEIVTVFNAGTTNVLTVGTNPTTYNDIVAAGDVDELTAGVTEVGRAWGRGLAATVAKPVYAMYTQSGTAGSTGQAIIVITFEGGWQS